MEPTTPTRRFGSIAGTVLVALGIPTPPLALNSAADLRHLTVALAAVGTWVAGRRRTDIGAAG